MKIKQIISQYRRDFIADMECEFCGHIERNNSGYDDSIYHNEVVPDMVCKKCGKSTFSEGNTPEIVQTKYPESYQI